VRHMQTKLDQSERWVCHVLGQPRSTQRYIPIPRDGDEALVRRMHELVRLHPRRGYRMIWGMLRLEGWRVNRKRVYRLWRQEGLRVPSKQHKKRRLGHSSNGIPRRRAEHKDHVWCVDFIHDRDARGRALKWLSVVDEHTHECLALEACRSLTRGCGGDPGRVVHDARRSAAHPQRQRPGVRCPDDPSSGVSDGRGAPVHRAGESVGERVRREFPLSSS
jgi:transposase InsO family protein